MKKECYKKLSETEIKMTPEVVLEQMCSVSKEIAQLINKQGE